MNTYKNGMHPFYWCMSYLLLSFITQIVFPDAVLSMCIVNVIIYITVWSYRVRDNMRHKPTDFQTCSIDMPVVTLCLVVLLLTSYAWSYWYTTRIDSNTLQTYTSVFRQNPMLYIAASCIFAPLGEESLFRYIIMNWVYDHTSNRFHYLSDLLCILISSAIFAVMHGTDAHLLSGLFFGFAVGLIYQSTHNLRICFFVHAFYNIGSLCISFPQLLEPPIGLSLYSILLLVGVFIKAKENPA